MVSEFVISENIRVGRIYPIIGNQDLGRIQIYGGGIENHTSLRVTQSFKLSLNTLIVPYRLRRGS